jgi:hypothetical protein
MAFVIVAILSALVYGAWAYWVPLLPGNLYVPLLDLGKITGYRWTSAWTYLALVLGLYALYGLGYVITARGGATLRLILVASAGFCAIMLFAYPATAVDVFGYIAHGRLLAFHNANPLIVTPGEFAYDDIIKYLAFPNEPSQYGPLWVLLNGALAWLARGDLLAEVLLYKGVAALAHLAGGGLVYCVARCLGDSRMAQSSAYLYLCNPMLLWEMVGNAHNDGLMMLFGLLAAFLFVRRVDRLVLPALAAGALIKIPIAVIAPLLFVALARRNWRAALEGALLAVALAAAVYRPFWEGPATLTALRRTDLFTASLGSVLRLALTPSIGPDDASAWAKAVSLSAFGVVFAGALVLGGMARTNWDVLRYAYFTLLGALLLATTWFQAWYVVWPLAIGAALPDAKRHAELALLSLGGLLQYFVFIYLWVMGLFPPTENIGVQGAAYLCIIGPLLLWVAARPLALRFKLPNGEVRSYGD